MRLVGILAGLGVLALATSLNAAQHGGSAGHAGGVGHPGISHPVGAGVPHPAGVGSPTSFAHPGAVSPPIAGVQMQRGRVIYMPPAPRPNSTWRFPQTAPAFNARPLGFAPVLNQRPRWILQPEANFEAERFRRFRYYQLPYFLLGGGGPLCDPFLPGHFGPLLWYDNQFSCFGVPWFGVDSYPQNFLAPDFAYEPWAENLQQEWQQQMYPAVDGQAAGMLDMTAGIAARESAESNPSIQITQLVLKEGIIIGLVDYWVQGDMLYYITVYNRENAVPLDNVDMEKTVKLNSDRGVSFVLQERSPQAPAPSQPAPPQPPAP